VTTLVQSNVYIIAIRIPTVAEIADRTALEVLAVGSLKAQGRYNCRGWKLYRRVPRRALPIHL